MCSSDLALAGEVAEWSNAPDSKSGLRFYRNVGSNPTLSAMVGNKYLIYLPFFLHAPAVPNTDPILNLRSTMVGAVAKL